MSYTTEQIHYQLDKMKIKHLCHYDHPYGASDLYLAAVTCTECRIENGEISLADIVTGRVDPLDMRSAIEKDAKDSEEDKQLRLDGKLPKHIVYKTYMTKDHKTYDMYMRYDCKVGNGYSAPVTPDRICKCCGGSIDE